MKKTKEGRKREREGEGKTEMQVQFTVCTSALHPTIQHKPFCSFALSPDERFVALKMNRAETL